LANRSHPRQSGNVTIGALTDNVTPIFSIIADADSDGAATTSETIALTLTPNADPTLATWGFTSTQSAGYTFDKTIDLTATATAQLKLPLSNDAVTPTLAFGDGDTGFYDNNDNVVQMILYCQDMLLHSNSFQGDDEQV
jgi:hypothetical protein